jgi:hypothetical protein
MSFVRWYGSCKELASDMVLVDEDFILRYPQVLGKSKAKGRKVTFEPLENKKLFKSGSVVMRKRSIKSTEGETEDYLYFGPLVVDKQDGRAISYHHVNSYRHTGVAVDTELVEVTDQNERVFQRRQLSFGCKLNLVVKGYEGDPLSRKDMIFIVQFKPDGKDEFMSYNFDLTEQDSFKQFCQSRKALWFILREEKEARSWQKTLDSQEMTKWSIGDSIYMDVRALGSSNWYQGINLPDYQSKTYIIKGTVKKFLSSKKKIQIQFDIYTDVSTFGGFALWIYSFTENENLEDYVLIDKSNVAKEFIGVLL